MQEADRIAKILQQEGYSAADITEAVKKTGFDLQNQETELEAFRKKLKVFSELERNTSEQDERGG